MRLNEGRSKGSTSCREKQQRQKSLFPSLRVEQTSSHLLLPTMKVQSYRKKFVERYIKEAQGSGDQPTDSGNPTSTTLEEAKKDGQEGKGPRRPLCSRCKNHDMISYVKGHKRLCKWKHCKCKDCLTTVERQRVCAKNQAQTRRQEEDKNRPGPSDPKPLVVDIQEQERAAEQEEAETDGTQVARCASRASTARKDFTLIEYLEMDRLVMEKTAKSQEEINYLRMLITFALFKAYDGNLDTFISEVRQVEEEVRDDKGFHFFRHYSMRNGDRSGGYRSEESGVSSDCSERVNSISTPNLSSPDIPVYRPLSLPFKDKANSNDSVQTPTFTKVIPVPQNTPMTIDSGVSLLKDNPYGSRGNRKLSVISAYHPYPHPVAELIKMSPKDDERYFRKFKKRKIGKELGPKPKTEDEEEEDEGRVSKGIVSCLDLHLKRFEGKVFNPKPQTSTGRVPVTEIPYISTSTAQPLMDTYPYPPPFSRFPSPYILSMSNGVLQGMLNNGRTREECNPSVMGAGRGQDSFSAFT